MESFRRKKLDRLTTGIFGLLVVGLCAGGYLAFGPTPAPPAARPVTAPRVQTPPRKAPPPAAEPTDPLPAVPPTAASAPQTPFKIRGVIYSPSGGSVVFIEQGGKVGIYRAGDSVGAGWSVASIGLESAELVRDGVTASLSLERPPFKEPGAASAVQAGMTQGPARRAAAPGKSEGGQGRPSDFRRERTMSMSTSVVAAVPPSEARNSDASVAVDRDVAEIARQDPAALTEGVLFEPIMNKGKMQGVQINKVPGDSYAARYGLASGDRIVAVNDQPIDSLEQALNLYNQFRNSNSVNVTIERAGQRKVVTYYVP